eukprot:jgi/Tetstr1/424874/TSEL_015369.t1
MAERGSAAATSTSDGPQGEELSLLTGSNAVKVILLGDSAVGKSKLVERFLLDGYRPHQLSTYALTLYRMHPSYYYKAHACIMVFDVTRKVTYKNLDKWWAELQEYCKGIPTIVVANKIDIDYKVTSKNFAFASKRKLPFFFVSASDGTNVVKVFSSAIMAGLKRKEAPKDDFYNDVLDLLGEIGTDLHPDGEENALDA